MICHELVLEEASSSLPELIINVARLIPSSSLNSVVRLDFDGTFFK
jgi:hypothetical protein